MPAERRSSSDAKPSTWSASRSSWYVWPHAAMPIQSSPLRTVTRFSWLRAPYSRASSVRTSKNSRSMSSVCGVISMPLGCGSKRRPSMSIVGMTGCTRSGLTSIVPVPSATGVTSFSPDQMPQARERATACRARSSASCGSPGNSSGMCRSTIVASLDDGRVDDLALGSSPTTATTPPCGAVLAKTACRIASPARSMPGPLPYQMPRTPSYVQSSSVTASWLPITAVAASSSLTPGRLTTGRSGRVRLARSTSSPNMPTGDPW